MAAMEKSVALWPLPLLPLLYIKSVGIAMHLITYHSTMTPLTSPSIGNTKSQSGREKVRDIEAATQLMVYGVTE